MIHIMCNECAMFVKYTLYVSIRCTTKHTRIAESINFGARHRERNINSTKSCNKSRKPFVLWVSNSKRFFLLVLLLWRAYVAIAVACTTRTDRRAGWVCICEAAIQCHNQYWCCVWVDVIVYVYVRRAHARIVFKWSVVWVLCIEFQSLLFVVHFAAQVPSTIVYRNGRTDKTVESRISEQPIVWLFSEPAQMGGWFRTGVFHRVSFY